MGRVTNTLAIQKTTAAEVAHQTPLGYNFEVAARTVGRLGMGEHYDRSMKFEDSQGLYRAISSDTKRKGGGTLHFPTSLSS